MKLLADIHFMKVKSPLLENERILSEFHSSMSRIGIIYVTLVRK